MNTGHGPAPTEVLLSRIEDTPLVHLGGGHYDSHVWAQCELFAPTGSHKDRMYLHAIRELERQGTIRPGMVLVDYSSGNGGAALAFVSGLLGYKAVIVRPSGMSGGKAAQITALGAQLLETPAAQGVEGAVQGARELAAILGPSCYLIDQGYTDFNSAAHSVLGRAIADQLANHRVVPDAFVCSVGTGGTFTGLARSLKTAFPSITCVAVDIEGQTMLAHSLGGHALSSTGHSIEGISVGKLFGQLDSSLVDAFVVVSEDEAIEACRLLWKDSHILAGFSSGANMAAVAKSKMRNVVTVFFDALWKYLDDDRGFVRPLRDRRASLGQALGLLRLGTQTTTGEATESTHLLPVAERVAPQPSR